MNALSAQHSSPQVSHFHTHKRKRCLEQRYSLSLTKLTVEYPVTKKKCPRFPAVKALALGGIYTPDKNWSHIDGYIYRH
ncbi:MAG: hypothetical protein RMY62_016725 [Nostoc sp. ZfuVER08]|jgi:hypothetical protein|uniref:Uncharacterized protein n=1 Tax=Nostoc punctiforme FACHB-252 TaxID=1357509 RepID=A0ABR8H425_NOSPU|nr:hypothetical protein [Nostoc punctiforme]MBD2610354.1 hypothetical protein [Nostoc punctiforme FACHB-252]MDZ8011210.1 hypothetical protein [Nostoc sp. ZfuVER08]